MIYTWWELSLMPGEGWIVRRFTKRNTLWARCEWECDRLVWQEAMDVLDSDSTWWILQQALALGD